MITAAPNSLENLPNEILQHLFFAARNKNIIIMSEILDQVGDQISMDTKVNVQKMAVLYEHVGMLKLINSSIEKESALHYKKK